MFSFSELTEFNQNIQQLVELLNSQAERIEAEKLKAIGQRNLIELETPTRKRRQQELQHAIQQKQIELRR